ncbi:MAG: nitrate reductase associated protein [Steroidobacteraceae bacterium]
MKRAIDRDVSKPSPYPGVFVFELDFGGTLRCIPMSVRLKLDQAGIKLSLKQWNKLPPEERRQLVEQPCDELPQIESYKQNLMSLIEKFTMTSVELMAVDGSPPWTDPAVVPERVSVWARSLEVAPPSREQWAALSPLQRFALFKLTRPGHSNSNFIPAMREFSLLP